MGNPKKAGVVCVGRYSHVIGKKWEDHELTALADEFLEWMEADESRCWFRKFFSQKRIGHNTVKRLRDRHEYLSEIYDLVKDIQEDRLVERGLNAKGNAVFTIMALKNCSGWRSEPAPQEDDTDFYLDVDFESFNKTGGTNETNT